ncbi:hypothetical protein B1R94_08810 [Mycolicibacterium litorale]|nr:hypothetical protein B1R94_08810 [Mycolicibacterium litorale]
MARAVGFSDLPTEAGIVVQDANGEIVAASAQAEAILGLTLDQMRGRTSQDPRWAATDEWGNFVRGAQHPAMIARRTKAAVRDQIMGVHRPGSDAAGHHVWLHVDAVPVFAADGDDSPRAVVAVFRPVTGDHLRILQLRDSERLFRMIAEHSSDMVAWQLVADSTFLWVSPATRTVLGFTPDSLIGTRGIDLVHPEDRALTAPLNSPTPPGEPPVRLTVRARHADGSYRWIETSAHLLVSDDDRPEQMITANRDVTDRVVAEQARDAAVRMFELAMNHATVGVALRSLDGTLTRVNPALRHIVGRQEADLIGHSLAEFTIAPDPDSERAVHAVAAGTLDRHEVEQELYRPDGTSISCLLTVIGLPEPSGKIGHLMVQLQDITAHKRATQQLERAALTDPLTGLPNRTVLEERLARALAAARHTDTLVGVLFVDLDNFKQINDTHGHDVGDAVLREVGIRLAGAVRHTDTVVRLGGDEFVVVREDLTDPHQMHELAGRLVAVLAKPIDHQGQTLVITASVGLAAAGGEVTAADLLAHADDEMYRVKRAGRR